MRKNNFISLLLIILFSVSSNSCITENKKKPDEKKNNPGEENHKDTEYHESFRKTGWISMNKYRAVIFIVTVEECKNSTKSEIEEKIRFEAYKNLQKELNPGFGRNAAIQIKNLSDNFGKVIKTDKGCIDSNIYFFDIEKNNLKADFEKIKNLKQ